MWTWFLIVLALSLGGGSGETGGVAPPAQVAGGEPEYQAEPQNPTGKFTTAAEVKQILTLTKAQWVAVREYDGKDLVYVTQILSWRCGLVGLKFSVNGAPLDVWEMPPCYEDTAAPNAVKGDALIYRSFPLGSVQSVSVELIYDDLTRDQAEYERKAILMP